MNLLPKAKHHRDRNQRAFRVMNALLSLRLCVAGLSVGVLAASCAAPNVQSQPAAPGSPGSNKPQVYPGTLLAPAALNRNVQWRQRITAAWPDGERSFDVVFSKEGKLFQLVGLSPLGMPGFVLRYQDNTISVENHSGQAMPFPARFVLLDAQRVFFPWFSSPKTGDGTRTGTRDGETITETWQQGKLVRRTFRRLDDDPKGEIVVNYRDWGTGQDAPNEATLVNNWLGYRLHIATLEQTRLE